MGDLIHLHRRLVGPYEPFFADPSRESRVQTRAVHTLGDARDRWNFILATD